MSSNLVDHPICLEMPERRVPSTWIQHTPFAMFLIDLLRPRLFVELGTFQGVSYCAFCQAVARLGLDTQCFGVDTWEGDPHTGFYGQDILSDLRGHHALRYGTFSNLIQSTFDDAKANFEDGAIDLLHIDGYHTYEAASHDFQNWLSKVSNRGIVLLHDIHVHERDFGVWKFWEEIKGQYQTFEVAYGCGLGVIAVGNEIPIGIRPLFDSPEDELKKIRNAFEILGKRVEQDIDVIYSLQNQLNATKQIVTHQQAHSEELQAHNDALQAHLDRVTIFDHLVKQSLGFRVVRKYQGAIERLAPRGTSRRNFYDTSRHQIIRVLKSIRNLLSGIQGPVQSPDEISRDAPIGVSALQTEDLAVNLTKAPLISVVIPTFNTPIQYLEAAIKSVKTQTYKNWELCICDDGSSKYETIEFLKQIQDETDPRIHITFSATNVGISGATNKAIILSKGDFIAFLDHDDELSCNALSEVAQVLVKHPDFDIIYSDQDKIDAGQNLSEPFYKPDWSPEFFRHVMYVGHLLIVRRSIVEQSGGFNDTYNGVQDYEFMLRASELTSRIHHIPRILYHWRKIPGSVAMTIDGKGDGIVKLQAQAVNDHLKRIDIRGTAEPHPVHPHRVIINPLPRETDPLVSIVIPMQDHSSAAERCIRSIISRSTYTNYEIIVVLYESMQQVKLPFENKTAVKMISTKDNCTLSQQLNAGIEHASGSVLVAINNQIEISSADWMQTLLFYLDFPDVGAVSPTILDQDGNIYHAGMVLGLRGTADHVMRGYAEGQDGYAGSLSSPREVSAVPMDCMMFRRANFQHLGGFSEYFSTNYFDLDFCLRLRKEGKRILCVPDAPLVRNASNRDNLDEALFIDRWNEWIESGDPYYNPNFSRTQKDYELE